MSKEHYVVDCYTCQHNGQETCKGCNTLLNGEDEPYQNWKLREDLEQKDNKIEDLQSQLAEKELVLDKILTEIHTNCYSGLNIVKWKEMVLNDLGSVAIKHNQDKIEFAIEQLEKVLALIHNAVNIASPEYDLVGLYDAVSDQIKQLKEGK